MLPVIINPKHHLLKLQRFAYLTKYVLGYSKFLLALQTSHHHYTNFEYQ